MNLEKLKTVITEKEIIDYIKELVAIPSYSGLKNQEEKIATYIHQTFINEGIDSRIFEVEKGRYNVVATIKGTGSGKSLLLTGHTDTVPPYDMENPFDLKMVEDKLYGRGVVDMKGPLACMIYSMIGIKRAKFGLAGDIIFAGVIDEEEGSLGTIDLLERQITADAAIVGEPTDLDICAAHRGLEWFEIEFHGKTVHGGKQSEGINAILKASNFIQQCEEKLIPKIAKERHEIIGSSSMNYGTIQGGTQPSTVAGDCVLKIDRRWVPGVTYEQVVAGYESLIEGLRMEDKSFHCTFNVMKESIMKEGYVHKPLEIDLEHPIISVVKETSREIYNKTPAITYFPAWTDGGLLSSYGEIPTLVFGPGSLASAHSAREYILKEQILPATLIYALVAMKFCK